MIPALFILKLSLLNYKPLLQHRCDLIELKLISIHIYLYCLRGAIRSLAQDGNAFA